MQKCLKVCEQKGARSIAFPALGAGNLGYPSRVVAKVMITTVQSYYKTNTPSCIKEVKFVIFKDDTYEEFEMLLSEYSVPEVVLSNASELNPLETVHSSRFVNNIHV